MNNIFTPHSSYRNFLRYALREKQAKNPSYTIGSLGRLLGLSASRMGQILNGKVGISVERAHQIAEILKLSKYDKNLFLLLVQAEHDRNSKRRELALKILQNYNDDFVDISDHFNSISDWQCHAITELVGLSPFSLDLTLISNKLGLTKSSTKDAIVRLKRLNLITEKEIDGKLKYATSNRGRRTRQDVPSEAVKQLNENFLLKAKQEIRSQDIGRRDYSIIFLKFNKAQIDQAKDKIKEFRRAFMNEFEASTDKNSVYCMGIQFFELTGNDVI